MLTPENFRFARQAGAEAIVAHLVDYFAEGPRIPDVRESERGWGVSLDTPLWSVEELCNLRTAVEAEGLELAAIENLDPSHWHDVLLDGPRKEEGLENVRTLIRRLGEAGIPVLGYNFSLAGVWGHTTGPWARGGAESVRFSRSALPEQTEIRNGMVWNMTYDPAAPPGTIGAVSEEQMWQRLEEFLSAVLPTAEQAGVRLALHPDDPPVPRLRNTARLVTSAERMQRVLDLVPSPSNTLEFCQGTVAEMAGSDVYEAIDRFSGAGKVAYVHFRNIVGEVPEYSEVFVDEGDVDMVTALEIYRRNGFDGVLIPDHTPQMTCDAPWHAGMAYALGYLRALLRVLETSTVRP
jgi:mannonate dehydratase